MYLWYVVEHSYANRLRDYVLRVQRVLNMPLAVTALVFW